MMKILRHDFFFFAVFRIVSLFFFLLLKRLFIWKSDRVRASKTDRGYLYPLVYTAKATRGEARLGQSQEPRAPLGLPHR